ncbi:MAG: RbsD/FucU family protein [Phycisphaeraceae bacterium]
MLKTKLIHPQILSALAGAGHHGSILIADGNYPASSKKGPNAELVHLNLMPGLVTCNQVLEAILSVAPVEQINTMMYELEGQYALTEDPPVWAEYRATIDTAKLKLKLEPIEKWAFYDAVATADHILTVQTGDQQRYANVLLHLGVRMT